MQFCDISNISHLVATLCIAYLCHMGTHIGHLCPHVEQLVSIFNSH